MQLTRRQIIVEFFNLNARPIAGNNDAKIAWHSYAKKLLIKVAESLGLEHGQYDIRSNLGGVSVSGEVTMHSDSLYVQFSQGIRAMGSDVGDCYSMMVRTCRNRQDFAGGKNQFFPYEIMLHWDTKFIPVLEQTMRKIPFMVVS